MEPRTRIGRYEVLTRLGGGGMAELFLGLFSGPGGFRKYVALKRILPHLRGDAPFIAMFLDEARISASLSHAGIAQVFDLGQDGEDLYLVMEFIAGQDLSKLLRRGVEPPAPLPTPLAAAVVREVCLALQYAHGFVTPDGAAQPVIHRDVSARNVMVTYSGHTKLIDFGIAKARGGLSQTKQGQVKGSVPYMAPEQLRGGEAGPQGDIFSAGALLYQLLTGVQPFRGDDERAVVYALLETEPELPRLRNPAVPEALSAVAMQALAKDPAQRFASALEMARAVEQALPELWREDQISAFMSARFGEALRATREVLSLAGAASEASLAEAVERLRLAVSPGLALQPHSISREADHATVASEPTSSLRGKTILAVDDSKVLRYLLEQLLSKEGYHVITAESGAAALEILNELAPDLIVLDVVMPEMDGFALCGKIRERPALQQTPVVFLSGACSLDERTRGLAAGGDDFLRKPFEGPDLLSRVRNHLLRAASLKERRGA